MHDDMLFSRFEEGTLDRSDWIHRAHVQMAYIYLRSCLRDEALERIRSGIKRNNARWQASDGPTSGYNETTTDPLTNGRPARSRWRRATRRSAA